MRVPGEGVGVYGGPWGWGGGPWEWSKCIWGSLGGRCRSLGMGWVHMGVPKDGVGAFGGL